MALVVGIYPSELEPEAAAIVGRVFEALDAEGHVTAIVGADAWPEDREGEDPAGLLDAADGIVLAVRSAGGDLAGLPPAALSGKVVLPVLFDEDRLAPGDADLVCDALRASGARSWEPPIQLHVDDLQRYRCGTAVVTEEQADALAASAKVFDASLLSAEEAG